MRLSFDHQKGFSIAEILISIAILSGIVAALSPMLFVTTRTAVRVEEDSANFETRIVSETFLRTTLEQAVTFDQKIAGAQFTGNARGLEFWAPIYNNGEFKKIKIFFSDNALKIQAPHDPLIGSDQENNVKDFIVTSDLKDLKIQYWGLIDRNASYQWRSDWAGPLAPSLIRFSFINKEDKNFSVDINLSIQSPLFCQFDNVSRECV